MKSLLICVALMLSSHFATADKAVSALEIVNKRMDAYNEHNLKKFLATYSQEVQIFDYPNTAIGKQGRAHLRHIFEQMFEGKAVRVDVVSQIEHGNYVVNEETVYYKGVATDYVSIYEVRDGLIHQVRFLRK